MNYLIVGVVSIIIYYFLTFFAKKFSLIDKPDGELKQHKNPVYFHGGIFLFLTYIVSLAIIIGDTIFYNYYYVILLLFSILFLVSGFIDDKKRHGYKFKLYTQLGLIILFFILTKNQISFNIILYILVLLFFIININSINIIDNFNGVSGLSYIYILLSLGVILYPNHFSNIYLLIIPILTFLFFNLRKVGKAKIFMGNNGSYGFGFLLSGIFITSIGIQLKNNSFEQAIIYLFKAPIIFFPNFLDTLTVVLIRLSKKMNPLSGSNDHLSHNLLSLGVPDVLIAPIIFIFSLLNLYVFYLLESKFGSIFALLFIFSSLFISSFALLKYQKIRKKL